MSARKLVTMFLWIPLRCVAFSWWTRLVQPDNYEEIMADRISKQMKQTKQILESKPK